MDRSTFLESCADDSFRGETALSAVEEPAPVWFSDLLSRTLPRLAMTSVPLSVFTVTSRDIAAPVLASRLRVLLDPSCEIAPIDDSRVGILFYGPSASRRVPCGQTVLDAMAPLAATVRLEIRTLEFRSVEMCDATDVILALRRAPKQKIAAPGRAAAA